ncbi:MAG: cytochrome P450 [Anaerolineae bacterium]|nr:cytochrome P450 [Anaerolineae bacterium]
MSRLDRFPVGASLTLADLENDVHPVLHRLRAVEPISWLPALNAWLVTRRDLAVEVMRKPALFTVDHPGFSTAQVVGPGMLSLDGGEHLRHRGPFEAPFRQGAVQSRFSGVVAAHVAELLDGLAARGRAELRREFAGPLAVKTMITALGLDNTDASVAAVLGWYDAIVDAVTRVTAGEPVNQAGRTAFAALKDSLLPALKRPPETSLLAAVASGAGGLSDDQIVSNAAVLLFGGIETTEGMIANALYFLLTQPDILNRVSRNSSLLPAVIEESLRLEPAAAVVDRYAVQDVRLGQAQIEVGELVQVSLAAANRDPAVFANPDTFDPFRPNLRSHVTFAQGPHVCLGLHLARLEAHVALAQLLARLPALQLELPEAAPPRGLVFRKPPALRVSWLVCEA